MRTAIPTVVMVGVLMALPSVGMAQAPAEGKSEEVSAVEQALTPAEQAKMRQDLQALAEAMGVKVPAKKKAQPPQQPEPKKEEPSIAGVANKALNMVNGLVASVAKTLEGVAPEVWRIMIRQQYAKAIADLIVPWLLLMLCLIYWITLKKRWVLENGAGSDEEVTRIVVLHTLPVFFGIIFFIWGVVRLSDSIKYLVNPEYYAVRDLLVMMLAPGTVQ